MSSTAPRTSRKVTPHPAGVPGRLTTSHGETLPVRGYERGEDVLLVLLVDLDDRLLEAELDQAELEYTSVRGLVRLTGETHLEDRSLIRFHPLGEAEVVQRRAHVRVPAPQEVTIGADDDVSDSAHYAHTVDLSGGGMLVSGADWLGPDAVVRFALALGTDTPPIEGRARVVRVREDGKRALMFEAIDEADRQRLIRYVFACLRLGRAKTRGDLI